ncbi:MAG: glycosyltransferase [Phycisphaerae bacterium]|nr:glycosyltransferase [Phycisphaerae bacterium]
MPTLQTILIVLAAATAVQLGAWVFLAVRVWLDARQAPYVRDALERSTVTQWPKVSVVVPAHNEARVARACAESILANDYPDFELVFVLDRCTDGTRASLEPIAARDRRLRIIDNDFCPDDWAGKCNAARVGEAATDGELVLFTDADTSFDPQLLRASVSLMRERRWRMLSLFSSPTHNHWFENVVQPIASIALLKLFPIRRANAEVDRRAFANGQFMLFERSAYRQLGGHAAVKNDLLEDMAFARLMKTLDLRQGVGVSGGMLIVSMYDSWNAFRAGWRRIYMECCVRNPGRMRRQALQIAVLGPVRAFFWAAAMVTAIAALAFADAQVHDWATTVLWLAISTWLVGKAVLLGLYRLCEFPLWSVFLFSAGCTAVASFFIQGARDLDRRTPVRWGGREYVLEPTNY